MNNNEKLTVSERMGDPAAAVPNKGRGSKLSKSGNNDMRIGPRGPHRGGPPGSAPAEKPKNTKKTVSRLLMYIGKSRYQIIALIIIMIATTVLSLAGPALQGYAINAIYEIAKGNTEHGYDMLIGTLTAMAGVYVLSSLFTWIQGILSAKVSQSTVYTLRKDLFRKISYLPIKYTDTHAHGDLMSRMTNDVDNISNTVSSTISSLISSVLTLIGSLFMIIWYSRECPVMAVIAVCTIPLTLFSTLFLSKHMSKFFVERQVILGELNGQVEEMVTGYETVMAYGRETNACETFADKSAQLCTVGVRASVWGGVMGPVMNFINNLNYVLVAVFGGYFVFSGALTPGGIQSIIQYAKQFAQPISQVANQYTQILTAVAGAERVFEVLDSPDETDSGTHSINPESVQGNLEFSGIDFSYTEGKQVLKDFELSVGAGQKIAIVGATGSGKTTVVNLLTRFYDINRGKITLDGIDIMDIPKKDLRRAIAIVLQDTVLFSDTIDANIRYGQLDAPRADVEKAAETANAAGFINVLPDGYDTILSESGGNLSQGQRQLLSIARAVLANPRILILDEATSSVDTRTEMKIQSAMIALMKGRTSLIIAHRLSTIRDADKIVVISDGRVVESGNHDELLASGGEYAKLYQNQFAGIET